MTNKSAAMDLDLDIMALVPTPSPPRAGPGRKAKDLAVSYSRDLTAADLTMAASAPVQSKPLARIRDSHHALARVLASGASEYDASAITGYTPSRISVLKADPQFKELLEFYRETATDVITDFRARMAGMGLNALQELAERLEEEPEKFSEGLLAQIIKDMADRTGHAPQRGPTTVTNVTVELGDKMKAARDRIARLAGPVIEGTTNAE